MSSTPITIINPRVTTIRGTATFTIATPAAITLVHNNTKATITIIKFATGKYHLLSTLPIFKAGTTFIHPEISEWASIPLSKTTWADHNYHFIQQGETTIEIDCQLANATYTDFTTISDPLTIPIHIEIYNQSILQ